MGSIFLLIIELWMVKDTTIISDQALICSNYYYLIERSIAIVCFKRVVGSFEKNIGLIVDKILCYDECISCEDNNEMDNMRCSYDNFEK
jgi:hypothetical protein